ncbi:MAG: methyltransferase domain-containing protein [Candidatus Norongarragalinales archaeon]
MQKDVRKVYDAIAERWNERHYKTRSWVRFFRPMLKKNDVVLDAGCGNGVNAISFAPFVRKIYAVDFSPKMVEYAKRNVRKAKLSKKIIASKADVLKLPFKNSFFNVAAYFAVAHHFSGKRELQLLFSEMSRVLKKKGFAFVTVRCEGWSAQEAGKAVFFNYAGKTGLTLPRIYSSPGKKTLVSVASKSGLALRKFFFERKGRLCTKREARNFCLVFQKL